MPGPIIHALTTPQWGLEATSAPNVPGAAVAATKKMAVKDLLIKPNDSIVRDQILKGLAIANRGNEVIVERGLDWEIPDTPYVFDEFHYWQGMAFVRPTKTGVGPFVWTSTLDPTTIQAVDMRTIELRYTDGTNNSDWEFQGFLTEIEIIGAAGQPVRFNAKGKGRRLQTSTLTAALALPSIVEVPTALTKVFIDSTWANRGTTQITGQIVGWRFTFATGLMGQITADGRTDQDHSVVLLNPDERKWTFEADIKANLNTGQWQTEKTAAEAGTLRAVEVRGDITSGIAYQFKLQGLFKHTLASLFPTDRNNGEVMAKLSMEGSTDDTNALAMICQNNVTGAIA